MNDAASTFVIGDLNGDGEVGPADTALLSGYLDGNNALTDEDLWRLGTAGGADATQTAASLGRIEVGRLGDLAIFKRHAGLLAG